jgi:hypothetical protein
MNKRVYLFFLLFLVIIACESDETLHNDVDQNSPSWSVNQSPILQPETLEQRNAAKDLFLKNFYSIFNKNPNSRNNIEKKYGLPVPKVVEVIDLPDRMIAFVPFAKTTSKLIEAEMYVVFLKQTNKLGYKLFEPKDVSKLKKSKDVKPNNKGKYSEMNQESLAKAFVVHNSQIFGQANCEHIMIVESGITGEQALESRDWYQVCKTTVWANITYVPSDGCNWCYTQVVELEYETDCDWVYGNSGGSTSGSGGGNNGGWNEDTDPTRVDCSKPENACHDQCLDCDSRSKLAYCAKCIDCTDPFWSFHEDCKPPVDVNNCRIDVQLTNNKLRCLWGLVQGSTSSSDLYCDFLGPYVGNTRQNLTVQEIDFGSDSGRGYTTIDGTWTYLVLNSRMAKFCDVLPVTTMVHEYIHAGIRNLIAKTHIEGKTISSYPDMKYYYDTFGGEWEHEYMVNEKLDEIVNTVSSIVGSQYSKDDIRKIAITGFSRTRFYAKLTESQKSNYIQVYNSFKDSRKCAGICTQ